MGDVMGLHKLTAGDGYTYLTRQVAVHDATDRGHTGLGDYYSEKGESPGRWWGAGTAALGLETGSEVTETQMRNLFGEGRHPDAQRLEDAALDQGATAKQAEKVSRLGRLFAVHEGAAPFQREVARRFTEYNYELGVHWKTPVPAEARAEIRTQVTDEMFVREHGRTPLDDRERAGFLAKASRQQTKTVAGYDLTFTPVKSVSTLWALADPDVAAQVEDAHHAAVTKTLAYLEREVLFTRRGRGGAQQVKATGLIAAMFTHRDARSGDPNLHTHVAISNKTQDATGRWLAVDGRVLYKANVTLSEMYNTLIESELTARLGVQFAARDPRGASDLDRDGKREVREIVGIDERLASGWSRRSTAIEGRRRELAVEFQAKHGRPPSPIESYALAQRATLETRQAKHAPRSETEQRATWRAEALQILGSAETISAMVESALGRGGHRQKVTTDWVNETAEQVLATVQGDRATWQVWHLRAEAQRRVRAAGIGLRDVDEAVEKVVHRAIGHHSIAFEDPDPLTDAGVAPDALLREDGVSVYSLHGSRLYTSAAIVEAERRLVGAAQQGGGRRISDARVGIAIAETAANGVTLTAAQCAMVRALGTSGARLQLTLAPAGTGKTTAMEVLARAWRDGGGTIVGLAPSAVAAKELRESIGGTCDTLSKLVWSLDPDNRTPDWVGAIDKQTLVIIDEAGMASTTELAAAVEFITRRGGSVRLVGDDRQLASVAAGGLLRDIATTVGAVTLTEVVRFRNADGTRNVAEAAATLAVRDGDTAALGFYADRGRIHVGDLTGAADQAYQRWSADVAAGKHSILLAPTRELVAELNTRARNDRLAADPNAAGPAANHRAVRLTDGTLASAGDVIVTRRNDRKLRITKTDWVKNGDRWTVVQTHTDGSITAIHNNLRRKIHLPKSYVGAGHVQLGYASTIHGAQGMTVDTSHTVLAGDEDRSLLYVATSRGRRRNDIYLAVGNDGDPHNIIRPETLIPPTALDQLAQIMRRDAAPISATTAMRETNSAVTQLRDAAASYLDAVTFGAEQVLGEAALRRLEEAADALVEDLTEAAAWPTLRSHLALRALDGHDPVALLRTAVFAGGLGDAADPAAVLDSRLDAGLRTGPLPWLAAIPTTLAHDLDWGTYLTTRSRRVVELAREIVEETKTWTPATAPDWAQPLLQPEVERLRAAVAVWRAVYDVPDSDLRPTGPRQIGAPGEHQAALNRAVRATRPSYPFAQRSWYQTLPEPVTADPWITPLCQRLARLERAGLPVATYLREALTELRPLPDEHAAAALWWRLVPHLGPAAVHGDTHTGDLLRPSWLPALADLAPSGLIKPLQDSPAWPALVAAVDEACNRHQWSPDQLLGSAFQALPVNLQPTDVCDALVLRIAVLTDPPEHLDEHYPLPEDPEYGPVDHHEAPPAPDWLDDDTQVPADGWTPAGRVATDAPEDDWIPTDHHAPLDEEAPPPPPDPEYDHVPEHAPMPAGHLATALESAEPEISRARIVELHEAAIAYYAECYLRSWAPAYLRDRLGTDLVDHPDFVVGYAPPSRTSLLKHLVAAGATVEELDAAGLVKRRDRGDRGQDWVDTFWDRLVMPIRDLDGSPIGFVGRRNPTKGDDDYAGPKYLNTRNTAVFTKGEALFGLAEGRAALEAGALPVLVEGPMDAYAISLGSNGAAVGIAPMGTALTARQIELLRRYFGTDPSHIAVATDADVAGWKSAQIGYWNLTTAGADPTHLALPDGLDPAQVFELHGTAGITEAVTGRGPLAEAMIAQKLRTADDWTAPANRLALIRETSKIIAARPIETWQPAMSRLTRRLHLSPGILEHEVLHHSLQRDPDPLAYSQQRIAEIQEQARSKKLRWELGDRRIPGVIPDTTHGVPASPPAPDRGGGISR
jgi:DNA primase catalytic core